MKRGVDAIMSLPFFPQHKEDVVKSKRVKQTQKQMGDISPSADAELKERSKGICELCGKEWAAERAHLTGRRHLDWNTKASDLVHLCTECHRWFDGSVEGIRARRMMATVMNYELKKVET